MLSGMKIVDLRGRVKRAVIDDHAAAAEHALQDAGDSEFVASTTGFSWDKMNADEREEAGLPCSRPKRIPPRKTRVAAAAEVSDHLGIRAWEEFCAFHILPQRGMALMGTYYMHTYMYASIPTYIDR
jgi:hypothetical protein